MSRDRDRQSGRAPVPEPLRNPTANVDQSTATWPPLTYELCDWSPRRPVASHSLSDLIRRQYRAAVVPSIATVDVILAAPTRTIAAEATAAIAAFDAEVAGSLVPFEALLLRSESAASSQIEQLTASAKAVPHGRSWRRQ
jgi:hypothetical protein